MKRTLLAAAASLALAVPAAVATAQDTAATTAASANLTAEQKAQYDGWPADRRAAYDAWPAEAKSYYWTLTPSQVEGWWVLNDEQRVQIVGMTPEQRTAAWTSIEAQMNGQAAAATPAAGAATTSADAGMAADTSTDTPVASTTATTTADTSMAATTSSGAMQFVRKETAQPVAASADAAALASGDLPTCKKGQQDGCINSWEKNKTGTKPLSYWPGKPASEIPGKKPDPAAATN